MYRVATERPPSSGCAEYMVEGSASSLRATRTCCSRVPGAMGCCRIQICACVTRAPSVSVGLHAAHARRLIGGGYVTCNGTARSLRWSIVSDGACIPYRCSRCSATSWIASMLVDHADSHVRGSTKRSARRVVPSCTHIIAAVAYTHPQATVDGGYSRGAYVRWLCECSQHTCRTQCARPGRHPASELASVDITYSASTGPP